MPSTTPHGRSRNASALAAGSAVSGLLAYLFFALATRALGPTGAAPVAVLWAYWSFAGAALTFPVQHWIARSVVAHAGEGSVRSALPGLFWMTGLVAAAMFLATWWWRELLFGRTDLWFPVLVAGVTLASTGMGVLRGVLSARERFTAVGVGLVGENLIRSVLAVVLVAADVPSPVAFGLCLLAGYAVVGLFPSVFRLGRTVANGPVGLDGAPDQDNPVRFLLGAGAGQVIGQLVLTGGPVLLALAGGAPAEITALFAGLALFRAPYTLSLGLVAGVTGWFSRLVVDRDHRRLRAIWLRLLLLTAVAAGGAAVVGAVAGPVLVPVIFGRDVSLDTMLSLVVAVASTIAMANLVLTVLLLALGRPGVLVRAWLLALVPGAGWFAGSGVAVLDRTGLTFLLVEVVAFGLLAHQAARGTAGLSPGR